MRTRLKEAANKAGYPRDLFCFHSLRSGFICSALIKNGLSNNHRGVFEHTGIVADWKINGRAQLRYIKDVTKRVICASRLVSTSADELDSAPIPHELISTEHFHGITLGPILWKHDNELFKLFLQDMKSHLMNRGVLQKNVEGLYRLALVRFVKTNPRLKNRVRAKRHKVNLSNESRKIGRNYLLNILSLENYTEIVQQLSDQITEEDIRGQNDDQSEERSIVEPKKRVRWTEEEDRILHKGYENGKSWVKISSLLEGRVRVRG